MPSNKWNAWDLLSHGGTFFKKEFLPAQGIITPDSYLEHFLIQEIKLHHEVKTVFPHSVDLEWFEEKFQGQSLFALFGADEESGFNVSTYLVHDTQLLSKEILELLITKTESGDFGESKFIFFFQGKLNKTSKKFLDVLGSHLVVQEIKEPKFWENRKLFDLYASKFEVDLTLDAKNYLLDVLEKDSPSYFNCFSILSAYREPGKAFELSFVKSIVGKSHIDFFGLAEKVSRKEIKAFFQELYQLQAPSEELRSFFFFIQGHLIKVLDPSYLSQKSRLSKYDESIQNAHKIWDKNALKDLIKFFSDLEIESKRKGFLLQEKIKEAYLASF